MKEPATYIEAVQEVVRLRRLIQEVHEDVCCGEGVSLWYWSNKDVETALREIVEAGK